MTEATKTDPAPLDAYETAKAGEPTFTLQDGDPLSAPLVRLWALLARVRTDTIRGDDEWIYPPLEAALHSSIAHDPREVDNLLLRATQAEQVSWEMDSYRKGFESKEQVEQKTVDEFARLDIYDIRRRCASAISAFVSDLSIYGEALTKRGFMDGILEGIMNSEIDSLNILRDEIKVGQ